jgi:hypothetical protein
MGYSICTSPSNSIKMWANRYGPRSRTLELNPCRIIILDPQCPHMMARYRLERPPNRSDRSGHRFFPVLSRFFRFDPGSLAERFCAPTGPDAGPVPDSTGPTDRSGFDNLAFTYTFFLKYVK